MSEENLEPLPALGLSYIVEARAFSWGGGPGVQGPLAGEGGAFEKQYPARTELSGQAYQGIPGSRDGGAAAGDGAVVGASA